jgi:hypothetical protein
MCTYYFHGIHPPIPFPAAFPPPTLQNLFHPSVLQFCRRKNIKDKKRNMTFLLVWDKNNYTGNLGVSLCCFHA